MPDDGINVRLWMKWMQSNDLNLVNKLVDKGIILKDNQRKLKLKPLVKEVLTDESKPTVSRCKEMLNNIKNTCIQYQDANIKSKELLAAINSIINEIYNDDKALYNEFLWGALSYVKFYKG